MSAPLVLVTFSVLIRSEAARGCVGKGCGIVLLGVLASIGLWILGDVLDSSSSPVTPDSPATKSRPPSSSPSVRTPPGAARSIEDEKGTWIGASEVWVLRHATLYSVSQGAEGATTAGDDDGITMRTAAAKAVDTCVRAGST
ncbi:hypothetical protein NQ042_04215 [Corynebacterium phoceense]|uniref:hypothetical protein n=1 Tax=Corynebacterium phoceense TaxID=1686286 RepID=UPI00211BB723|nr:hypothetical protein [Corynebacterium phoceense]MCQ9333305.1 hypothetical protein [Corynebacterium phoceense]